MYKGEELVGKASQGAIYRKKELEEGFRTDDQGLRKK